MEIFREQAARFGTEVVRESVTEVDFGSRPFRLTLDSGEAVAADSVIISTGASAKLLGIPSERDAANPAALRAGVSACATCDGFFYKGKNVVVVGGGGTAMEEATCLTKFCATVPIVHRREEFRASKIMLDRARHNPKIKWKLNAAVEEIVGGPAGVTSVQL